MDYLVSIVAPVYNLENHIEKCIKSILNQTLNNFQLILVNDGSTDRTKEIIEDYIKKDKRIKVINKKNGGIIEARKSGIKVASGEYILFIDGDDWLENNALEILYNNAISNKSDIVLYNGKWIYDNKIDSNNTFRTDRDIKSDLLKSLFLGEILPGLVFKFVSRKFISKINMDLPFPINHGEDLATTSNLFMNNPRVSLVNNYLYNYYQRDTSLTNKITDKVLELLIVIDYIEKLLNENGLYQKYKEEFECMVYINIFEYKIITYKQRNDIVRKLYSGYKSKKINIKKNRYIRERLVRLGANEQRRIKIYDFSYSLGMIYDTFRNITKNILVKVSRVSYEN